MGHKRSFANTYPGYFTFVSVTILFAPCDRVFFSMGTINLITSFWIVGSSILANIWRHCRNRSISFVATQFSKYHIGSSSSSICKRSHSLLAKSSVGDASMLLPRFLVSLCGVGTPMDCLRNEAFWQLRLECLNIGNICHENTKKSELRRKFVLNNNNINDSDTAIDIMIQLWFGRNHCRCCNVVTTEPVNRHRLITSQS